MPCRGPSGGASAGRLGSFERAHAVAPRVGQEGDLRKGQVQQDPRMSQGIVSLWAGSRMYESANVRLENGARA